MSEMRITDGKGVHFTFDNGITLSIQIGSGNYSENYNEPFMIEVPRGYQLPASKTAEIAVWADGGDMIDIGGDTVRGYVPVTDVLRFAEFLRALPNADNLDAAVSGFDWGDAS